MPYLTINASIKLTSNFTSAEFHKMLISSKLYHIVNSKTIKRVKSVDPDEVAHCDFLFWHFNSFNYQKADDKIFVCKFSKNVMSKLNHFKNSKTRGQTVTI